MEAGQTGRDCALFVKSAPIHQVRNRKTNKNQPENQNSMKNHAVVYLVIVLQHSTGFIHKKYVLFTEFFQVSNEDLFQNNRYTNSRNRGTIF